MPKLEDHLSQAQHNFKFYQSIDTHIYSDWAATALFYTALHYIDAFLAVKQIHPGKHDVRDKLVNSLAELKGLYPSYSHLKNQSRNARYIPPTSLSIGDILQLENEHLSAIRDEVGKLLPL